MGLRERSSGQREILESKKEIVFPILFCYLFPLLGFELGYQVLGKTKYVKSWLFSAFIMGVIGSELETLEVIFCSSLE